MDGSSWLASRASQSISAGGTAEAEREGSAAGIRGESPCAAEGLRGGLVISLTFRRAHLGSDGARWGEGTRS